MLTTTIIISFIHFIINILLSMYQSNTKSKTIGTWLFLLWLLVIKQQPVDSVHTKELVHRIDLKED